VPTVAKDFHHYKNGGALSECAPAHYARGGRMNAKRRNALPGKDFAGPDRSYPINDANHARNALARVSQFGSPEVKARVRSAVHRKYPNIGKA